MDTHPSVRIVCNEVFFIPMQAPSPSSSTKKLNMATSGGNKQSDVIVNGKNITVGVNVYINAPWHAMSATFVLLFLRFWA